jgi:hypothetical protein
LRALVYDVASVQGGGGLEEQDPAFFVGDGTMFDTARDDDELAFFDPFVTLAKLHAEAAFDYKEEFVFVLVMVKDEFAFEFVELDVLAVEFGGDVGLPVFGDLGEFFGEVDLVHRRSLIRGACLGCRFGREGRKKRKASTTKGTKVHEGKQESVFFFS